MDHAQHVRSRGRLRPRALPVPWRILLEGDPDSLPFEHGKETLEELFIAIAREPLTLTRTRE